MLFRNSYRPHFKSQQLTSGDWAELAGLFDIPVDSLQIDGSNSFKEVTVYTCIKILSEAIAKLPMNVFRKSYQEDGSTKIIPVNDYRYNLLKLRPNPFMTAYDFWRLMEAMVDTRGNAYALIDVASVGRNAGQIQGLYPAKPDQMTVYVDDVGLLSGKNRVWYMYRDDMGQEMLLDSDSVLHFKGLSINGIIGLSVLEYLRTTIENARGASAYLNTSYKKGMQGAGILQYTGGLDDAKESALRDKFEKMTSGIVNTNRIAVMPLGLSYQSLNLKMTDAQFLENTQLTIQQLTAAFGIKPHQVNDQTKTSYASTSEANREFYTDTLLGKLTEYEQETRYKLFLPREIDDGYYTKFNVDVLLRGDISKRYDAYAKAIQNGFKMPNEVRALEEDPPKEGGDQLFVNGNMIPITMAGSKYKKGGNTNA